MSRILKSKFVGLAILICLVAVAGGLLLRENSKPVVAVNHGTVQSQVLMAERPVAALVAGDQEEGFPQPNESDSNEELLQLARSAVTRSPERALKWAQSQADSILRERLLFAVIRAWAENDPHAAVAWAQTQNETERQLRMEAALTGVTKNPGIALQIGRELLLADRETADTFGRTLVGALGRAEQFQAALQFLSDAPPESRAEWAGTMFNLWGQTRPDDAAQAIETIRDPEIHAAAAEALVSGWAASQPATLADYAMKLSSEKDRERTLNAALENWCLQDPAAMGEWLNSFPATPVLDKATALLVTRTDGVNRSPQVAISWVAAIADPDLRRDSLVHVAQEWAQTDSDAVSKYVENISWLDSNQRSEILNSLHHTP